MQVYLPDDLYQQVKARGLPASELLQKAVRAELRRLDLLAATDRYVADLVAEVGPPDRRSAHARRRRRTAARATTLPPGGLTVVVLVLDSGGVSRLAERSRQAAALILALRDEGLWPPLVPSMVLVECLQGHPGRDALPNSFLKTCDIVEEVGEPLARRAALLRRLARGCRTELTSSILKARHETPSSLADYRHSRSTLLVRRRRSPVSRRYDGLCQHCWV